MIKIVAVGSKFISLFCLFINIYSAPPGILITMDFHEWFSKKATFNFTYRK